jgi:PAS domain S-box-containing protein
VSEQIEKTHEIVDLAFDAMFTRDFDSRYITSWNTGAERLYGWSRAEALGKIARDLLASEYPMPLEKIEAHLLAHGTWEGEIVQRRKDGSRVVVRGRWGLQVDRDGRPLAILEINSDLTQQHASARELLQSEEQFALLVQAVVDYAIFMLDSDGNVMTWNEGAQRAKGYTRDEIVGRHFSVFYPQEDLASGKPKRALETAAREGRFVDEDWRVRKDGTRFWASVVITALRDDTGQVRGFVKVTRDLTERHAYEEGLRAHAQSMAELEKAKAQFLDLAAHELRGPLTLIRGYNSILEEGALPPERISHIAHLLEGKLSQVDLLVEQMLEMARLENERLELHLDVFDLCQLAADQVARFRPVATGSDLAMTDASKRTMVRADRSRIATIIGNLIDNAIKYSPRGGQIRCSVGSADGQSFVSVSDHGLGIETEHLPLLFKRFSRLPTLENKSIPGTGLALYLCQEIARRHGGRIDVASTPGHGSVFTLHLPAYDKPPDPVD